MTPLRPQRLAVIAFATAALALPTVAAAADAIPAPLVVHAEKPERLGTIRLSDLPVIEEKAAESEAPRVIPNQFPKPEEIPAGSSSLFPSPAGPGITYATEGVRGLESTDAFPTIDVRFDAPFDGGVAPPDPVVAVGRNHAVALVNLRIAMYSKAGALLQGPFSLTSFFGIPAGFSPFDPLAIYDPFSNRYIVAVLTDNGAAKDARIYIAFSQTDDATGTWNKYFIDADRDQPNNWSDYGSIGIDRFAVYLTTNNFQRSGSFSNVTLYIYDKEDGYVGLPLDNTHLIDVRNEGGGSPFRLRPAEVTTTVPGDKYYLMWASNSFGSSASVFTLTGDRFASPSLTAAGVPLPSLYFPVGNARQPGTGGGVSTLGTNLWNVYYRNGKLWTAQAINGSSGIAAWVHRIDVSGATPTREQTYQVEQTSTDLYFPYVVPDTEDNDFALLTAYSSSSVYASGRYWNVSATGSIRTSEATATGTRRNDSGRHGDYFAMTADPTDPNRVWMIAQYMSTSTFAGNSGIASVRFEDVPAPSAVPPVPDGQTIPGTQIGVGLASGSNLTVTWDTTACVAPGYHLVWYDLATIASYTVADRTCAIGTTGTWTGAPPSGNVAVIVVGDDNATTEGSHGVNSSGVERPSTAGGCGLTTKRTDGTCP